MKVQCDVCAAEAASVFCCADEAALCDACDRRVHRANKLAGKHRRFSLLSPAPSPSGSAQQAPPPLCDICQDKRGLLFCKEDRAILCRDCDVSVHTASELTMRHTRFLLTGVRLSAEPAACPPPPEEEEEEDENSIGSFCCSAGDAAAAAPPPPPSAPATSHGSDSSSISEYLTKTLPGWHVEDFLVDEAAAAATDIGVSADASYQGGLARIGGLQDGYPAWMAQELLLCEGSAGGGRERWVPQMAMYSGTGLAVAGTGTGTKRSRATAAASSYSYW